jgi:hypothetical protein
MAIWGPGKTMTYHIFHEMQQLARTVWLDGTLCWSQDIVRNDMWISRNLTQYLNEVWINILSPGVAKLKLMNHP